MFIKRNYQMSIKHYFSPRQIFIITCPFCSQKSRRSSLVSKYDFSGSISCSLWSLCWFVCKNKTASGCMAHWHWDDVRPKLADSATCPSAVQQLLISDLDQNFGGEWRRPLRQVVVSVFGFLQSSKYLCYPVSINLMLQISHTLLNNYYHWSSG